MFRGLYTYIHQSSSFETGTLVRCMCNNSFNVEPRPTKSRPTNKTHPKRLKMAGEYSTGSVIDYLISNNEGHIKTKKNNRITNHTEHYFNKNKPLSTSLQNNLNQVSTTRGFNRFNLLKRASHTMRGIKTIQKHRIRTRAKTSETLSALKRYANTYSITNIPFKGYKGLTYLKRHGKKRN